MKILELFSGTGSVGKVFKKAGHQVISLDLKDADINCNILEWDYKQYEPGSFDYIHASPPCDTFSWMRKINYGKPLRAHNPNWKEDKSVLFNYDLFMQDQENIGVPILNKTLEIIEYLKPKYYTIENPYLGDMKKYLTHLKHNDITYCKYGFPYKKQTRVWNNISNWKPKPICCKNNFCDYIRTIKDDNGVIHTPHIWTCGPMWKKDRKLINSLAEFEGLSISGTTKAERYRIPEPLINEWLDCMN